MSVNTTINAMDMCIVKKKKKLQLVKQLKQNIIYQQRQYRHLLFWRVEVNHLFV